MCPERRQRGRGGSHKTAGKDALHGRRSQGTNLLGSDLGFGEETAIHEANAACVAIWNMRERCKKHGRNSIDIDSREVKARGDDHLSSRKGRELVSLISATERI